MVGLSPKELPGPLREVQAVAANVDPETLKHRLADAVGAPLQDVWTDESGKQLEVFHRLVAQYRAPQKSQKVIVTAAAMQIVTLGPRHSPEHAIVLTVVNHNDWAVRVTSASLEFPDLTPEGKVRGIMPAMNTLPALVPPHDSAKFVFPEDGLADARAIGVAMKAYASLSTGEVIYAEKPVVLERTPDSA